VSHFTHNTTAHQKQKVHEAALDEQYTLICACVSKGEILKNIPAALFRVLMVEGVQAPKWQKKSNTSQGFFQIRNKLKC